MTLAEFWTKIILPVLPFLGGILLAGVPYFLMRTNQAKLKVEIDSLKQSVSNAKVLAFKDDALASEIFQRALKVEVESGLQNSQTMAGMREKIEKQDSIISILTRDLTIEKSARIAQDQIIAALKAELEIERSHRLRAVAELESLKELSGRLNGEQAARITSLTNRVKTLEAILIKADIDFPPETQ